MPDWSVHVEYELDRQLNEDDLDLLHERVVAQQGGDDMGLLCALPQSPDQWVGMTVVVPDIGGDHSAVLAAIYAVDVCRRALVGAGLGYVGESPRALEVLRADLVDAELAQLLGED